MIHFQRNLDEDFWTFYPRQHAMDFCFVEFPSECMYDLSCYARNDKLASKLI
jgi:hypothetical protein